MQPSSFSWLHQSHHASYALACEMLKMQEIILKQKAGEMDLHDN